MTDAARTRIGKITLKSGGSVRVLHTEARSDCAARFMTEARWGVDNFEMAGYAIVAWQKDSLNRFYVAAHSENPAMPLTLVPVYAQRVLTSEIGAPQLEDQIIWPEPDPAA